jgi:hypothetical protein
MRQASITELCVSVLAAGLLANDATDDSAIRDAFEIFDRIREGVDLGASEDHDLAARAFALHAQLLASALAAGHDVAGAMKIADEATAAVYAREDGT